MIKILHFADVHLDSPFSLCDVRQSEQRRNELRSAFTSVMAYVRTSGIKYVLIPGDLFDYGYVSKETVELVRREFEVNPSTRFIIAPGNHDPYSSESVYAKVEFPDNVYIFDSSELTALEFPDDGVDIYGYAFTSPYLDSCPFAGQRVRHPERINILIGHGDTTSAISRYCPISERDITAFGADYTALGHIHNTDGIHTTEGGGIYAYSGCLEGRSFDECGHKGAIIIEAGTEPDSGEKKIVPHPYRFSRRRYAIETVDITGAADENEVSTLIRLRIAEKKYGEETTLRIVLTGTTSPDLVSDLSVLKAALPPLYASEILDRALPIFDDEYLKNDITIRGEFYRAMLPKLTEGSQKERETAAWALRYGLSALAGENIIDF
ncbi:MAG: DNA repair exonuclease [Clostridia bacterium]|nr:DNA repair exonuclease [Clostridia bacterium]